MRPASSLMVALGATPCAGAAPGPGGGRPMTVVVALGLLTGIGCLGIAHGLAFGYPPRPSLRHLQHGNGDRMARCARRGPGRSLAGSVQRPQHGLSAAGGTAILGRSPSGRHWPSPTWRQTCLPPGYSCSGPPHCCCPAALARLPGSWSCATPGGSSAAGRCVGGAHRSGFPSLHCSAWPVSDDGTSGWWSARSSIWWFWASPGASASRVLFTLLPR